MYSFALWETFQTLSKPEIRDLERVVLSPFFNRKEQLVRLFGYLRGCVETKTSPEAEAAFQATYPDAAFSVEKLRLAYSDLLELTEQYWTVQAALDDRLRHKIGLAAEYRRRGLPRHRQSAVREARQSAEEVAVADTRHFAALHDLEMEVYQLAAAEKRAEAFNLQRICDLSDMAFIAQQLQHVCTALSHQAVFKTEYRFGMLEAIYRQVETEGLLQYPAIALYYHASHFLKDAREEAHFAQFTDLLRTRSSGFPEEEQRTLYVLAINFGVKKCNTGLPEWYRNTFDLYREALERHLLLERGMLSRFAYNNIAIIGGRVGETEWVERFLTEYKPLLDRAWREASFSLNMARLEYSRKRYGEALRFLQHADYKDFINSMNAKILQMKIYYETDERAALGSHLDSMQGYIRRNRAGGYHRDNFMNIVQFTRALLHLVPGDASGAAALREAVRSAPVLTEREWLLFGVDGGR